MFFVTTAFSFAQVAFTKKAWFRGRQKDTQAHRAIKASHTERDMELVHCVFSGKSQEKPLSCFLQSLKRKSQNNPSESPVSICANLVLNEMIETQLMINPEKRQNLSD